MRALIRTEPRHPFHRPALLDVGHGVFVALGNAERGSAFQTQRSRRASLKPGAGGRANAR